MPPKKQRGRHDSGHETESESQEYIGSFETLRDEGEHFVHVANYKKAIDSFTKAMEFKANDKQCLVARSKCYLQLGDAQKALVDAETALEEDKGFIKGFFQKAESMYVLGDFETALVFFHRGHKARPELQEFRLGIQKSQEAINNSIGTPESVKLETKGDLSFFEKQEEEEKTKPIEYDFTSPEETSSSDPEKDKKYKKQGRIAYSKPQARKEDEKRERKRPENSGNSNTIKQLLGELYGDKEFLERLLNDESLTGRDTPTSVDVKNLIIDGLEYLDTRSEFWRQQKPLYARKRDQELRTMGRQGKTGKNANPTKYVLKRLEEIDEAQSQGKYEKSLDKAEKTLRTVQSWSDEDILNRNEIIANLHSQIGNAHLEMGHYELALDHHEQDLEIGENNRIEEARSRALDNIGRVHARSGDYGKAVGIWEKKLPLSKSALESTWLYHELGRCYLEMEDFDKAKDYGEKSLSAAREAEDLDWTLHSTVLIAQSEVKLHQYQSASDSFEQALDLAQTLGDFKAQDAIKKAIEDVNDSIVEGMREGDKKCSERGGSRGSERGGSRGSERRGSRGSERRGSRGSERGGSRGSNRSRSKSFDGEGRVKSRGARRDSREDRDEKSDVTGEKTKDSREATITREAEKKSPSKELSPQAVKSHVVENTDESEKPVEVKTENEPSKEETYKKDENEVPKMDENKGPKLDENNGSKLDENEGPKLDENNGPKVEENEADKKDEKESDNDGSKDETQEEEAIDKTLQEEEYKELELSTMRLN